MTTPAAATATHNADGKQIRVYEIPDPTTGELCFLPNISSVVDVLQTWGLADWKLRMAAVGIACRQDLQARIAAGHVMAGGRDRNRQILDAVEDAIAHGQTVDPDRGHLANDLGSAVHLLTELIDEGRVPDIMELPTSVVEYAANYVHLMASHGVQVVESEFTVFGGEYAGTGDRIIRLPAAGATAPSAVFDQLDLARGTLVLDIKTGRVSEKAAMQLAALANGRSIYDAGTGEHRPLPADIRTDVGLILHLTPEGAALIPVDLDVAWPAFTGALSVKTFCDSKPLHKPLVAKFSDGAGVTADHPSPSETPPKVVDLMGALATSIDAAKQERAEVKAAEAARATAMLEDMGPDALPAAADLSTGPVPDDAPMTEPHHIADVLPQVIAAIPYDAPDEAKAAARTEWLMVRGKELVALNAQIAWPVEVPTFGQARDTGTTHTLHQLDLIEQAISLAEQAVGAPFPDQASPTDTRNRVTADDPRVIDILTRFDNLPADLRAAAANDAAAAGTRRFSTGSGTEQCVQSWHRILDVHEQEATTRAARITNAVAVLTDAGVTLDHLAVLVGTPMVTGWQADRLDELADILNLDALTLDGDTLTVDPAKVLDAWGGSKRPLLAAAKGLAKAWGIDVPAKADDALANPLIAAALLMTDSDPAQDPAAPAA
jgi:hypothetical protein